MSPNRNHHLTSSGADDRLAITGSADKRVRSTRRRGDGRYSSSQTSKEENMDRFTFQQQKKYEQTHEKPRRSSSSKTPYTEEDTGSESTIKRHGRRQSRVKPFDDEVIAEERDDDDDEKPSTSQNSDQISDQISDMETGRGPRRKSQRGNALPPLRPKKKKKQRKVLEEPMAVMYND